MKKQVSRNQEGKALLIEQGYSVNCKRISSKSLNTGLFNLKSSLNFSAEIFSRYKNASAFLVHVALNGNREQRSEVAKCFDLKSVFSTSEIHPKNQKDAEFTAVYLKQEISDLAFDFGVEFKGDVSSMAYDIIQEYGGLTYLDCMKFFYNARMSKYKNDMQHVSARGLTREFLIDWLHKYMDERDIARVSIINEIKESNRPISIDDTLSCADPLIVKKMQKERVVRKKLLERSKRENVSQYNKWAEFWLRNHFVVVGSKSPIDDFNKWDQWFCKKHIDPLPKNSIVIDRQEYLKSLKSTILYKNSRVFKNHQRMTFAPLL